MDKMINKPSPQIGLIKFMKGVRTALYKPVLLKSIFEISTKQNKKILKISEIADKFIKILWIYRKKFHLSLIQGNKTAAIEHIILKIDKKDLKKSLPDSISNKIIKKVLFRDVIYRLRNDWYFYEFLDSNCSKINIPLKIKDETEFSKYKNEITYIQINEQTFNYFLNTYFSTERVIEYEIARQLEKFNDVPRIIEKVLSDNKPRKKLKQKEHDLLLKHQLNLCFYCNKSFILNASPEIHEDHFIPWSFVYDTSIDNIVLACADCNRDKSDKIPIETYKLKLINRNNGLEFQNIYWEIVKDNQDWKRTGKEGIKNYFLAANETIKLHYSRCIKIFEYDWKPSKII